MRALLASCIFLLVAPLSGAFAQSQFQSQPHHAGIARIEVPADIPFEALIWYPTDVVGGSWQDRSRFPQHTMPLWPMVSFRSFCFRTEAGLAGEALSCCANYRLTLPDRAMSSWRHFMARQVLAVAPRRSSLRLMPFWQTRDSNRILILLGLACWASR